MKSKIFAGAFLLTPLIAGAQVPNDPLLRLDFYGNDSINHNAGTGSYKVKVGSEFERTKGRYNTENQAINAEYSTDGSTVGNRLVSVQDLMQDIPMEATVSMTAKFRKGYSRLNGHSPFIYFYNGKGTDYGEGLYLSITSDNGVRFGGGSNVNNFSQKTVDNFTIDTSRWYNYTIHYRNVGSNSRSDVYLYIDGVLVDSLKNNFPLPMSGNHNIHFGGSAHPNRSYTDIDIDNIYVWGRALTSPEISNLANVTIKLAGIHKMDENVNNNNRHNFNNDNLKKEELSRIPIIAQSEPFRGTSVYDREARDYHAVRLDKSAFVRTTSGAAQCIDVPHIAQLMHKEKVSSFSFNVWAFDRDSNARHLDKGVQYFPIAVMVSNVDAVEAGNREIFYLGKSTTSDDVILSVRKLNGNYVTGTYPVDWTRWNMFTVHIDNNEKIELYVNAVRVWSEAFDSRMYMTATSRLQFGALGNNTYGGFFGGSIDDISYQTRLLTASEIEALYQNYMPKDIPDVPDQEPSSIHTFAPGMDVKVFPNPSAAGIFTLSGADIADIHYTIKDMTGSTIVQQKIHDHTNRIDLSAYPAGIYLLELKAGDRSAVIRLAR